MSDDRLGALDILTRGHVVYDGKAYTTLEAIDRALEDVTIRPPSTAKKAS